MTPFCIAGVGNIPVRSDFSSRSLRATSAPPGKRTTSGVPITAGKASQNSNLNGQSLVSEGGLLPQVNVNNSIHSLSKWGRKPIFSKVILKSIVVKIGSHFDTKHASLPPSETDTLSKYYTCKVNIYLCTQISNC